MTGGRYTGRRASVVVGTWPSSFVGQISPIPRRAITAVVKPPVRSVLYCALPPSYLVISSHRLLLKELSARGIRQRPILAGQAIISLPRSLQQGDTAPPAEGRNDGPVIYLHRGGRCRGFLSLASVHTGGKKKKRFNEARVPGCFGAEPARGRGTRLRR